MIVAFFAGVTVNRFWKQIKEWADLALGYILNGINKAVEVTSDAFVYLVKEGTRLVVKRMIVGVQNIYTNENRSEKREEEISRSELPDEIKAQLEQRAQMKLMQLQQQ